MIENVQASTLTDFVREAVSTKVTLLCTDQWVAYKHLGEEYLHASVDRAKGQYVRSVAYCEKDAMIVGAVHTQTIEDFWSIFKRGIVGSFHKVSRKYMPLYVAEFQFRYNNRGNADIFGAAIEGC